MLIRLSLIVATIVVLLPRDSVHGEMPYYIKKALQRKELHSSQMQRAKTKTLTNLTLKQVFDKIKEITRTLNLNAMRNGYKVDYKFRVIQKN